MKIVQILIKSTGCK